MESDLLPGHQENNEISQIGLPVEKQINILLLSVPLVLYLSVTRRKILRVPKLCFRASNIVYSQISHNHKITSSKMSQILNGVAAMDKFFHSYIQRHAQIS